MSESIGEPVTLYRRQVSSGIQVRGRRNTPKYPQYALTEEREKTFKNWDKVSPLSRDKLIAAGLFYTEVEDVTLCFYCGIPLCHWEKHDDPFKEHASHSPGCQFLQRELGENNIKRSSRTSRELEEELMRFRLQAGIQNLEGSDEMPNGEHQEMRELETKLEEERERRIEGEQLIKRLRQQVDRLTHEQSERQVHVHTIVRQAEIIGGYEASLDSWRKTAQDAVRKSEEYKLKNQVLKSGMRHRVHEENYDSANLETADPAGMADQLAVLQAQVEVYREDFEEERRMRIYAEDQLNSRQHEAAEAAEAQQQVSQVTQMEQDENSEIAREAIKQCGCSNNQITHAINEYIARNGNSNYDARALYNIIMEADSPMDNIPGGGMDSTGASVADVDGTETEATEANSTEAENIETDDTEACGTEADGTEAENTEADVGKTDETEEAVEFSEVTALSRH